MLRVVIVFLFILGICLPFYVTSKPMNFGQKIYQKTHFKNFDLLKLSKTKSTHLKATNLTELDRDIWQAKNPIINEDEYNLKKTTITADMGIMKDHSNIIELFDNVNGQSSDPAMSELKTQHLIVRKNEEEYECNGDTTLIFENKTNDSAEPTMSELKSNHLIIRKKIDSYESKGFTVLKNNNQTFTGFDFIYDKNQNKFIIPNQSKLVYNR